MIKSTNKAWVFLVAVLFCELCSAATPINSGQQYFLKRGQQAGCSGGVFMGYLNKTCSASGPVLRAASEGNTWTQFTITNLGKSAQNEDLVEIKTYYPINSSQKPRCTGYIVPEMKNSCSTDPMAVHIRADKGYVWALSSVKAKQNTYTIRTYSRKSGCLKYLAASPNCGQNYLQLESKDDDGSGRQHWTFIPVKISPSSYPPPSLPPPPRISPPPLSPKVEVPAVNYTIALTGYNKDSFGASQQTAFCNSILNATSYPQNWMQCIVSSVTNVPLQSGRRLKEANTVYVGGHTAFEFIYGDETSQQQAQDAADGLYKDMDTPATLQVMFQPSFSSSNITADAVDRFQASVPEDNLPLPPPSPPSPSPTPSSPSSPSSPTLSPEFNTVPWGDGVITDPPVTSPVPDPTPIPTPTPVPPVSKATAYVINFGDSSVVSCTISGGTITTCNTPYTGPIGTFGSPSDIAISGSTAYITNQDTASVTACTICEGAITTCAAPYSGQLGTFSIPSAIAIDGSTAYIINANPVAAFVTACTISGLVISNCLTPFTGQAGSFDSPIDIAISGSTAYILNNASPGSITACSIAGGAITTCNTPYTGPAGTFSGPQGIAISGSRAYITNFNPSSVTTCTISGLNITNCAITYTDQTGALSFPYGIAIYGSKAYITNDSPESVTACSIAGGIITTCDTPYTGQDDTFNYPKGIAIA